MFNQTALLNSGKGRIGMDDVDEKGNGKLKKQNLPTTFEKLQMRSFYLGLMDQHVETFKESKTDPVTNIKEENIR